MPSLHTGWSRSDVNAFERSLQAHPRKSFDNTPDWFLAVCAEAQNQGSQKTLADCRAFYKEQKISKEKAAAAEAAAVAAAAAAAAATEAKAQAKVTVGRIVKLVENHSTHIEGLIPALLQLKSRLGTLEIQSSLKVAKIVPAQLSSSTRKPVQSLELVIVKAQKSGYELRAMKGSQEQVCVPLCHLIARFRAKITR